jgi:ParB family transcriptional regulator, chromosome partitioning protein
MSKQVSKGLGKGFGSLLPDNFDQSMLLDKQDRIQKVALSDIQPNPDQPRRTFEEQPLNELASSIKLYGILQPLVVTKKGSDFEIVAGERRFHAAKKAGLTHVPVIERSLKEIEKLEISLVENVQRVDLNAIEQAVSIVKLHEQFNISYEEIAERMGKHPITITNIVRLLQLPDFAREALTEKRISEGHGRAILSVKTEPLQKELLNNIEQFGWSVRAAEAFASQNKPKLPGDELLQKQLKKTSNFDEVVSKKLSTHWGFKITVKPTNAGGSVAMKFNDREQLNTFLEFLEKSKNE